MSWTRNVSFYFFVSWNFRYWKSISLMEISFNPSNYLGIIFYDQCALSPQSLFAKSVYISYWLWQEINNFLTQITYHMIDGNQFLNRGISFSLTKPTRWKIYLRQQQNSITLLSVKIAADQLIDCSSVSFRWIRVWAIGKYEVTLWETLYIVDNSSRRMIRRCA